MLEFINGTNVEQATTGLLNLLGGCLEAIANVFGISIQYAQEHFIEYLVTFGTYKLALNLVEIFAICGGLLLTTIVITHLIVSFYCATVRGENHSEERKNKYISFAIDCRKAIISTALILFIGSFVLYAVYQISLYKTSPELYSVHQAIEMLGVIE